MNLLQSMKGTKMPCGGGDLASNWGWIISRIIKNRVNEVELTGEELFNLLVYLVHNASVLIKEIINYEDFTILGVRFRRISDEELEEKTRQEMNKYLKENSLI